MSRIEQAIADGLEELQKKTLRQIQVDTAYKWSGRACAAALMGRMDDAERAHGLAGGALQKAGRDRSLEALEGLKCSESPVEPSHLSDHLLGFHQIVDLDLDGLRGGGLNDTL